MSDEQQVWDRQEGETLLWFKRFERFRLMEPVRSIAAVFQFEETERNREKPRTKPTGDWYEIAKEWKWEDRAAAWDVFFDAEIEKTITAERKKVLKKSYALMHKRVETLDTQVQKLLAMVEDEDKVWVPDVKSVGTGPTAERVDLVQFNDALFREIRAHLTDIASEMGERVKTSVVKVKELPKLYLDLNPDEDGVEP